MSSSKSSSKSENLVSQPLQVYYEGEALTRLLKSIGREIDSARILDARLPYKIWLKQQFSIGVNDVTRVLERMLPVVDSQQHLLENICGGSRKNQCDRATPVQLQVILVAFDCNPRWLTKHLPSLASSREVPIIFVKDNKEGSLRLGELFKLRTAIAIGVKARGTLINQFLEEILQGKEIQVETES